MHTKICNTEEKRGILLIKKTDMTQIHATVLTGKLKATTYRENHKCAVNHVKYENHKLSLGWKRWMRRERK